jgi:hypothetical protein
MTVQTNTNVANFEGNGVTQIFPIAFKFNNDTDLVVLLVDEATGVASQLTLNSDYTVSGEGDEEGGSITVLVAPTASQRLTVIRRVDILQLLDLRNQGKFFAEVHEAAFDLLTMIAQQHQSEIGLSLRVAETDPQPARIPPVAQRANMLMAFDANGNPTTALPVADSSTELRQELAAVGGVGLVGGAMRRIPSVNDLRSTAGWVDGEIAALMAFEAANAPLGGGLVVWDAQSTAADDGGAVFAVSGVTNGRWLRHRAHLLCPDDFGVVHEDSPTTDQTAKVQAFFNAMSGRSLCVGRTMTVGVSDTLVMPSDVTWKANGVNLYTLGTFVGDTGFRVLIKHVDVSNISVEGLKIDGNQAAFGGLFPVVEGDITRGVAVMGGCENIEYKRCVAVGVVGNAFIHLSGGFYARSYDIRFVDCVADNCGLGFGQETKQGEPVADAAGPGMTVYDNSRAILCNYGLYIAGGEFRIEGGHYHSKRLSALTLYTGDAHAPLIGTANKPKFEMTPEVGQNSLAVIHCINKQSIAPNYEKQQFAKVTMIEPEFICNHLGINIDLEEGFNLHLVSPVVTGGGSGLRTKLSTLSGGPYRKGTVTLDSADFNAFNTDAVRANFAVTLNSTLFRAPIITNSVGVNLLAGADVTLRGPIFGAAGDANQLSQGAATTVDGTILRCTDARAVNVGTLFSVGSDLNEAWVVENSSPAHALDRKKWRAAAEAPTAGTWLQGEVFWNSAPISGASIGWICVASGTPGTWKSMGSVAA